MSFLALTFLILSPKPAGGAVSKWLHGARLLAEVKASHQISVVMQ